MESFRMYILPVEDAETKGSLPHWNAGSNNADTSMQAKSLRYGRFLPDPFIDALSFSFPLVSASEFVGRPLQNNAGSSRRIHRIPPFDLHDFIATQALGAAAPLCMGVGSKDSVPADFHEEKIGTFSGSPGAKLPAAYLLPFVATS